MFSWIICFIDDIIKNAYEGLSGKETEMNIREIVRNMKMDAPVLAATAEAERNNALLCAAKDIGDHREEIFAANAEDVAEAQKNGVSAQIIKRLKFDEGKMRAVIDGMHQLTELPDPIGKVSLKRELDQDLILERISCPIGVIGVIFEARPDALVQISSLCLKSGNCAILKGGRETARTNRILYEVIHNSFVRSGMPEGCLKLAETHNEIDELLDCYGDVDLLIPRGSNAFVRYIMEHTKIPVMGHADGVCHIYVDRHYDRELALSVIRDAKTQYPVACNSVEMILVNREAAPEFLPLLWNAMSSCGVSMRFTEEAAALLKEKGIDCTTDPFLTEADFHREYGELILSVCLTEDVRTAAAHINRYGSHHTDCIITSDDEAAAVFMQLVDSAGVYRNVSTRFADGFRYGFGAEVGISTSKLHARGPVGLEGLVTYKYLLSGKGQTVNEYASGTREFHHRDLL